MIKEIKCEAVLENLEKVTDFVDEELEALDCPMKVLFQINVAIDEIFSNIAQYAYRPTVGPVTVQVEAMEDPTAIVITFIDNGVPYDPLAKDDPDISLPADERETGGLGIYLVKKTMDDLTYQYKDSSNVLKIKKCF